LTADAASGQLESTQSWFLALSRCFEVAFAMRSRFGPFSFPKNWVLRGDFLRLLQVCSLTVKLFEGRRGRFAGRRERMSACGVQRVLLPDGSAG